MNDKQKPSQWKITKFLKDKAPQLLDKVADVLPNKGGLGILKNLISNDKELSKEDKEMALKLIEIDIQEMEEVSKRWASDMTSDSWLSKNVRPLTLLYLLLIMTVLVIGDSIENTFKVDSVWVDLIKSLLISVVLAYFGSRGFEKYTKIKK
jgi:hypothetical protein